MRGHALIAASLAWLLAALVQSPRAQESQAGPHASLAFDTSDNCLACHNGLMTSSGEDVSIGVAWRASMMANASRDPYWLAGVRRETIDHPTKKEVIEDECSICHMPMARTMARAAGRQGEVFRLAPGTGDTDAHRLAADGVSCTLCHQISAERLGTRESFVGGFMIAPPENGQRQMFGPFDVTAGRAALMHSATGVRPTEAEHIRRSEVCATCHTLITEAFGPSGEVVGSLPEQMPYQEWRHSAFASERSCQSCHMPDAASTPIASVVGEPRERMARHTFLGGNAFMLRMLNRFRAELGVTAPSQELDAAAHATLRQLAEDTASVSIERASLVGGRLEADVVVSNRTGHKLPTGYPSRRAWLHVVVRDAKGRMLFESGATRSSGAIAGNDNDADPARFEPHYEEIRAADQVQIYEAIMGDRTGGVTTGLLQATSYLKDNRLLPRGFDKATSTSDIAVRGPAAADRNFTGEGDRVTYVIDLADGSAPFELSVELRYQTIAFRWADNLRRYNAAEPRRFVSFYDAMAESSTAVLARATARF
jgi:cytochrome c551/c552